MATVAEYFFSNTGRPSNKAGGFTLMEMSMVLVIIGLIIGGVIVGQSLIRQSQLNSVVTDEQRYVQAMQNFQTKYAALPGDMPNATAVWGDWSTQTGGACPTTYASQPTGTYTCNGDGNGIIGVSGQLAAAPNEQFTAWQQLVSSQMLTGHYTGAPGSAGNDDHVPGQNCPASRVKGGGFAISYLGSVSGGGNAFYWDGDWGHEIVFGGYYGFNNVPLAGIITAAEALSLDTKYDDGSPGYGNITTYRTPGSGNCITTNVQGTAQYNITQAGLICALVFKTGF